METSYLPAFLEPWGLRSHGQIWSVALSTVWRPNELFPRLFHNCRNHLLPKLTGCLFPQTHPDSHKGSRRQGDGPVLRESVRYYERRKFFGASNSSSVLKSMNCVSKGKTTSTALPSTRPRSQRQQQACTDFLSLAKIGRCNAASKVF